MFNARDIDGLTKYCLDLTKAFTEEHRECIKDQAHFRADLGVLLLSIGLLESLTGGKACMLLCDFVNF